MTRLADMVELSYDKLGSRLRHIGDLELEYDRLGNRLNRVGSMGVEYDMAGSRVRRIGRVTVDYDKLGSRPRYLQPIGEAHLDEQVCVVAFLVLIAFNRDG